MPNSVKCHVSETIRVAAAGILLLCSSWTWTENPEHEYTNHIAIHMFFMLLLSIINTLIFPVDLGCRVLCGLFAVHMSLKTLNALPPYQQYWCCVQWLCGCQLARSVELLEWHVLYGDIKAAVTKGLTFGIISVRAQVKYKAVVVMIAVRELQMHELLH